MSEVLDQYDVCETLTMIQHHGADRSATGRQIQRGSCQSPAPTFGAPLSPAVGGRERLPSQVFPAAIAVRGLPAEQQSEQRVVLDQAAALVAGSLDAAGKDAAARHRAVVVVGQVLDGGASEPQGVDLVP